MTVDRYEISTQRNSTDHAQFDYGHIRAVSVLTGPTGIDPVADVVAEPMRAVMRPRIRMWSLDAFGEEIEALAR